MKHDAPIRAADESSKQIIARARAAFRRGELSEAARLLAAAPAMTGANADRDFLTFALAAYGLGDIDAARERHETAPPDVLTALRYRMLIAMDEFTAARAHRRSGPFPPEVEADFRWTLSRAALWSGRTGRGLRLYDARVSAQNFSGILPRWLRHDPAAARADRPAVALEQGLGDRFFHIGQMRAMGARPSLIFGAPRDRRLVGALWSDAEFCDITAGPGPHQDRAVACAGDWLALRHARDGRLGPIAPEPAFGPARQRRGVGLCWRGGSAQNRREEREIPLQFFLDLLPRGPEYVVLQHDLRDTERRLLARRPDIAPADFNLTGDALTLVRAVGRLAGVITVDSANAHAAGLAGTPLLLLMNPRAHWFWGRRALAGDVYQGAETLPISAITPARIEAFTSAARGAAPAAPAVKRAAEPRPIFITGCPRSRTSMVAGALAAGGLRLGRTIGPTVDNPNGFSENRAVREEVLKPLLSDSGFDPFGVTDLPPPDWRPAAPGLRDAVTARLAPDGEADTLWGYKDPKLLLLWRRWSAAFPEAVWVIVDRPAEDVARSCLRTGFMARHSANPHFWAHFVRSYRMRADALAAARGRRAIRLPSDILARDGAFPPEDRARLATFGVDMDAAEAFLARTRPAPPLAAAAMAP